MALSVWVQSTLASDNPVVVKTCCYMWMDASLG